MTTRKKVCMLGAYAVGKTSLVSRWVHSLFSDRYQTTVGVKIDKHDTSVDGRPVTLLLWDIHGEDELQTVRESYLKGSDGLVLVADGTRAATLDKALELSQRADTLLGSRPSVLMINKSDLLGEWDIDDDRLADLARAGWTVLRTSAKTGDGVPAAFEALARRLLPEA